MSATPPVAAALDAADIPYRLFVHMRPGPLVGAGCGGGGQTPDR